MTNPAGARGRSGRVGPRRSWRAARLHVVTGKGGAGKTTVSAALAIALATGGRRVLVVEVEERGGLAPVFDVRGLGYDERRLIAAPGRGEVVGLAIDPHEALMEYLALFHHMRRAGRTLERIGAVDFATSVAPGLRDVLLTGKVFETVNRREPDTEDFVYDAVVLDAPPTGRITSFMNVSTDVVRLAKIGPTISRQAQAITRLFRSPRTAVHLVTLLEEMSVQETLDAVAALEDAKFTIGSIVLNATRRPELRSPEISALREGEVEPQTIADELARVGITDPEVAAGLLAEGQDYVERIQLERRSRRSLRRLDYPTLELPQLRTDVDAAGLYELARALRRQVPA